MADSNQTDLLDGMIARLEKANASAYERFAHQRETALKSKQEAVPEASDQRPPIAPERQSSRARPLFVGLLALTLAASVCVAAFAGEPSYVEAVKAFVRWANPWGSGALSQAQMTPKASAAVAPPISPEVPQQLQKMADDLANVKQQIERLKASQEEAIRSDATMSEQFKASQQQIVRDNAKAIEQLSAALAQMTLKNEAVAEQLKTSQEQLAELASFRAMASVRKHVRRSRSPMAPLKLHR
jgi:septal ring factor EnvC (AmiA/AmiB activator)